MNMRENQHRWKSLMSISMDHQPLVEVKVKSLTKRRSTLSVLHGVSAGKDVVDSLLSAGFRISRSQSTVTRWHRGQVEGIDWVELIREEEARLNKLKRLGRQNREERAQWGHTLEVSSNRNPVMDIDSAEPDTEGYNSSETVTEEDEEETDSEAVQSDGNDSEGPAGRVIGVPQSSSGGEASRLGKSADSGRESSKDKGNSSVVIGEKGKKAKRHLKEQVNPEVKSEKTTEVPDEGSQGAESRYWGGVHARGPQPTIKQERGLSVAAAISGDTAVRHVEETENMHVVGGTDVEEERQQSDAIAIDLTDEQIESIKRESRRPAEEYAHDEDDSKCSDFVKLFHPPNPDEPTVFPDSATLKFGSPEDWEQRWNRVQRRAGKRMIVFGPGFAVTK
jgi:hypothetical protein